MVYVILYLGAIVAANLLTAIYGPSITIINAFLFIGLDLTSRDALHERWNGSGLRWKMAALIATGSVLSYAVNSDSGRIAAASFVAFALAGAVDSVIFHLARHAGRAERVHASNAVSAAVDSVVFPTLAFGVWMPAVIAGQWVAKVGGGAVWLALFSLASRGRAAIIARREKMEAGNA